MALVAVRASKCEESVVVADFEMRHGSQAYIKVATFTN